MRGREQRRLGVLGPVELILGPSQASRVIGSPSAASASAKTAAAAGQDRPARAHPDGLGPLAGEDEGDRGSSNSRWAHAHRRAVAVGTRSVRRPAGCRRARASRSTRRSCAVARASTATCSRACAERGSRACASTARRTCWTRCRRSTRSSSTTLFGGRRPPRDQGRPAPAADRFDRDGPAHRRRPGRGARGRRAGAHLLREVRLPRARRVAGRAGATRRSRSTRRTAPAPPVRAWEPRSRSIPSSSCPIRCSRSAKARSRPGTWRARASSSRCSRRSPTAGRCPSTSPGASSRASTRTSI